LAKIPGEVKNFCSLERKIGALEAAVGDHFQTPRFGQNPAGFVFTVTARISAGVIMRFLIET